MCNEIFRMLISDNVRRLHTENKQGSRWHVATGVQVGSDLIFIIIWLVNS